MIPGRLPELPPVGRAILVRAALYPGRELPAYVLHHATNAAGITYAYCVATGPGGVATECSLFAGATLGNWDWPAP